MSQEIYDWILELLRKKLKDNSTIERADFDELKILYSRSRNFFPQEFRVLLEKSSFTSAVDNYTLFKRLLRILTVIDTLPAELKHLPEDISMSSTALIPLFEIQKDEKARIFDLCSDMRKIVLGAMQFDEPHRLRLLNRIAAIEAETHKPKGIFDVVRGGVNDLGEALGKFGADIKPLTDRMAEIVKIARRGTKEYDQLPPPDEVKRLPAPGEDESNEN